MNKIILIAGLVLALVFLAGCKTTATSTPIQDAPTSEGSQVISLGLSGSGYSPAEITVKAGIPVTLKNDGTIRGCAMFLVQRDLGINANFADNDEYTFTPTKKGTFTYACSMGMWKGVMHVI